MEEIAFTAFLLVLLILFFDRLLPQLLFARTRGLWIAHIRLLLEALFYLILPVTLTLGLLLSIVALAEPEDAEEEEHPSEAMDALLEAGEEEGILEESDRELVRSAVEFGDKVVREVMTPRPEIFAVPETLTLEELSGAAEGECVLARAGVCGNAGPCDRDCVCARPAAGAGYGRGAQTVAELQRPTEFVPETKKVAELLREMQQEKQHMRIVIDEYGGVAGLVTIEDLMEAIVGSIADEHDEAEEVNEPVREADGVFVVPGSFEVSRLRELFAEQLEIATRGGWRGCGERGRWRTNRKQERAPRLTLHLPQHYRGDDAGRAGVGDCGTHSAARRGGGRGSGCGLEVLASTDRKVERVRVRLVETAEE